MTLFQTWNEAVTASVTNFWVSFIQFIPSLLGALVVLIVGFLVAIALRTIVSKLIQVARIDSMVETSGVSARVSKTTGLPFSVSGLIGWLVKWFVVIVTLTAVADILGWRQVTEFLQSVVAYIPDVAVAVIILLIGLIVGQFIHDVVEQAVKSSRLPSASAAVLAMLAKWAIVVFALMASLTQLGIAAGLIQILFTGLVAALALAFGLAFGLGGREKAAAWLARIDREMFKNQ